MSKNYNRKDHLYQKAKDEGLRSRAAYKLEEIQKRFKILRKGDSVLDLGAWPGGWVQAALAEIGPQGKIVAIDLTPLESTGDDNVSLLEGNFSFPEVRERIAAVVPGGYHAVISDASPKLTGISFADQAATAACAIAAFEVAELVLKTGGNFVCKIFKGAETDNFVRVLKKRFEQLSRVELDATRSSSSETYVVGKRFKR